MILFLLVLFQIKHLVFDFILQRPYQYLNKGKYGHPGGLLHSGLQGLGTALVISLTSWPGFAVAMGLVDFIIHYHIDWGKMNLNKYWGLKPDNSEYFWWLLGADQFLHQLTYIGIIAYAAYRGVI